VSKHYNGVIVVNRVEVSKGVRKSPSKVRRRFFLSITVGKMKRKDEDDKYHVNS
jgi:hypothetical protein